MFKRTFVFLVLCAIFIVCVSCIRTSDVVADIYDKYPGCVLHPIPHESGRYFVVEHDSGLFFVRTNAGAFNCADKIAYSYRIQLTNYNYTPSER